MSVEDQLHRQWLEYLTDEVRMNCWHIFIAPEIGAGLAARQSVNNNVWNTSQGDRLLLMSWAEIRDVLARFTCKSNGPSRWAASANQFLEKIGICRFRGFSHLSICPSMKEQRNLTFYKGITHGFKRFSQAALEPEKSKYNFQPFFWK